MVATCEGELELSVQVPDERTKNNTGQKPKSGDLVEYPLARMTDFIVGVAREVT